MGLAGVDFSAGGVGGGGGGCFGMRGSLRKVDMHVSSVVVLVMCDL